MRLLEIHGRTGMIVIPLEHSVISYNKDTKYTTFASINGNVIASVKIDYTLLMKTLRFVNLNVAGITTVNEL